MEQETFTLDELNQKLTEKQKIFCNEYIFDWNGSRSYKKAYPNVTDETARVNASKLLTNTNILQYINYIKADYEKLAQISKLKVILEWKKIAFSNITDLFEIENNELKIRDSKKLSELPKEVTDLISEIQQTKDGFKLKLYCKDNALVQLAKLMGWNEPDKIEHNVKSEVKLESLSTDELKERYQYAVQIEQKTKKESD